MSYKFIKTKDPNNEFDRTNVEIEVCSEEVTLDDLLEDIEDFLRACGYSIHSIEHVKED